MEYFWTVELSFERKFEIACFSQHTWKKQNIKSLFEKKSSSNFKFLGHKSQYFYWIELSLNQAFSNLFIDFLKMKFKEFYWLLWE